MAAETAQDRDISWADSTFTDFELYGSDLSADIASSLHNQHSLQQSTTPIGNRNMTTIQQQDALAVAQNGGLSTDNSEEDIEDTDDGLDDDDMMDKISSSPSIEDGGYPTFLDAPSRLATLEMQAACARAASNATQSLKARHISPLPEISGHANPQVLGNEASCYSCTSPCAESITLDVDEDGNDARRANLLTCRRDCSYTTANGHDAMSLISDTHLSRHEEFFDDDEGMTVPYIESGDEVSDTGISATHIEAIDARYVLSG